VLFSSYLAGSDQDSIYGLDLWNDELYLAGRTASTDFPTTKSAPQKTYAGGVWDVFLTQVNLNSSIADHVRRSGNKWSFSSSTVKPARSWQSTFKAIAGFDWFLHKHRIDNDRF